MSAASLFVPAGDGWLPTELSRGPWSPDSLHGGSVAALVARQVELADMPVPQRTTRLTVELMRPVPLAPLRVAHRVVRPGRKVATVDVLVELAADGSPLVMARAQRVRTGDVDLPDGAADDVPDLPVEAEDASRWPGSGMVAFHSHAVEHRFVHGVFGVPGPAFDWTRLRVPVVPGETPSGWQRAAATADFTNGLSSVVPFDGRTVFINPDLTVHLWREPIGEWVGTDAGTRTAPDGIGTSSTELYDRQGRVGLAAQSLLLDRA